MEGNMLSQYFDYSRHLVIKGGPDVEDYYDLNTWFQEVIDLARKGHLKEEGIDELRQTFGETFSTETMQGLVFQKPYGYAGDYEILDRIYCSYVAQDAHLSKWDVFFQQHPAAVAVRNRSTYFSSLLERHASASRGEMVEVLNLVSGPGRDMLQYLEANPQANVHFDCVDQDAKAVDYARLLCVDFVDKIDFYNRNVLRFRSDKKYQLIWSGGLFDYFEDKLFVHMLKKLKTMVANGGEIVIGNFSTSNPSKHYMDFLDWNLKYRSAHSLKALAKVAGCEPYLVAVDMEPAGVNLFLCIKLSA